MIKNFTFTLPDGPYLTTTENGQTVNCTYNGAKYLCLCVNNETKMVRNVERTGETIAELDMDNQIEDGHFFVVLDASVNPLQAAYLTHDYTHEEIEDIEETLTDADGETFTFNFHYDDTGVIGQVTWFDSVKYISDGVYEGPKYREHVNDREDTISNFEKLAEQIDASLKNPDNEYSDADRTKLEGHRDWLKTIRTKYADHPHWKIPFKSNIPTLL